MEHTVQFLRASDAPGDPDGLRFGRQCYLVVGTQGDARTVALDWDQTLLDDLEKPRSPDFDDDTRQRLGNRLRELLAASDWNIMEAEIVAANARGEPVYLTIRSSATELYLLPWDFLTIEATGEHISELEHVYLSYAWPRTRTIPRASTVGAMHRGRVLLAWSTAGGRVPVTAHADALAETCAGSWLEFAAARDIVEHVGCSRLSSELERGIADRRPVNVLHILCHGSERNGSYGMLWDDERGDTFVTPNRLRPILKKYGDHLRLVVLCACDAANPGKPSNHLGSVVQALHRVGLEWVIGSRYPLSFAGSVSFTNHFYGRLAHTPEPLQHAFSHARRQMLLDTRHHDWASMQLYTRPSDRASWLIPDKPWPQEPEPAATLAPAPGVPETRDAHYVQRANDRALEHAARVVGETVIIKGPRQYGKTSLLLRYLTWCRQQHKRIALVDFSILSARELSDYPTFLDTIAVVFARALGIATRDRPRARPPLDSQARLTWFIEDEILARSDAPVVFAIDQADRVLGQPFQDDFFSMLRLWHNLRAHPNPAWHETDLALVISTEPYLLIANVERSPFSVGRTATLGPFHIDECRDMNQRFGAPLGEREVELIHRITGGHPHLVRLAFERITGPVPMSAADIVDTAADEHGPFGSHLREQLRKLQQQPRLLEQYRRLILGEAQPDIDTRHRLAGAGLVRDHRGMAAPASPLYAAYFRRVFDVPGVAVLEVEELAP